MNFIKSVFDFFRYHRIVLLDIRFNDESNNFIIDKSTPENYLKSFAEYISLQNKHDIWVKYDDLCFDINCIVEEISFMICQQNKKIKKKRKIK